MKTYIYRLRSLAIILLLFIVTVSCDKDGDSVGISSVTYFPTFELTAGEMVVIKTGDTFTPGATVMEGDTELTPDIEDGVDNTAPGIYYVVYSAVNGDGYSGSAVQTVIVHDPSIVATDVSGDIYDIGRPSRTGVISLVEGTNNIFYGTDMGFAGAFPMYFMMDGDTYVELPQTYPLSATSVSGSYDPGTRQISVLIQPYGFDYTFQIID